MGSRNQRLLSRYEKVARRVNALEPELQKSSDSKLRERASALRRRARDGLGTEELLPEAYALVREASVRTLGLRHFDVQLIGGIALHEGKIAEMRTGEGKTLVATLPAFLNSLGGDSVHIVTRERLSGAARRRVDGPRLPFPEMHGGRGRQPANARGKAPGLPLRRLLRHQQ